MRSRFVVCAAVVVAAAGAALPSAWAEEPAAATVTTVAGSEGEGPARTVSQSPTDILVEGDRMLVADAIWGVIRETDLVSGVQRVLYRHPSVPRPASAGDTRTPFPFPMALARAHDGGLYVSQRAHHRVVKIDAQGQSVVVAGDGRRGYLGDGGPAAEASLAEPAGLAVDAAGNLLIADQANHAVRRVSPDGTITTFAGSPGPAEGCDAPVYWSWAVGSLCPTRGYAGDGGPAGDALLDGPARVRLSASGDVYIAGVSAVDYAPLRRVAPDGTISTLAGADTAPASDLHSDQMCSYSGDSNAHRFGVHDVATVPTGELLIATGGWCVHRLDPVTRHLELFAGGGRPGSALDHGDGGPAVDAVLREVWSLASASGRVLIAEPREGRVRQVDRSGVISTVAGVTSRSVFHDRMTLPHFAAGNGAPATSAQLPATTGLAVSADGGVYVGDQLESVVRRIEPDGLARAVVGQPATYGDITGPTPVGQAMLAGPTGLSVTAAGSLYIADGGMAVRRLRPDGWLENVAGGHECKEDLGDGDPALGTELHGVTDVTPAPQGGLYLVEAVTGHLRFIDEQGRMHILVGPRERPCPGPDGGGVTWEHEGSPLTGATGVAAATDGSVWVTAHGCLNRFTPAEGVVCVAPLTPFSGEEELAYGGWPNAARPDVVVDPAGVVTFSDPHAHVVRQVAPGGVVTTLAGNGANTCAQPGSTAATASFAIPTQLALHPDGSVLVADAACHTIHRIGTPPEETVTRAAGPDRLATAGHVSRSAFADGSAGAVVLARADDYADALTGTPLAVRHGGPLLLTPPGRLAAWPESELRRVLPRGGTVYLLGGDAALSPQVATRVRDLGYVVVRLAGRDRYGTAVDVAERGLGSPGKVLLTTGTGFADALGAAVAAAHIGGAVLLTAGERPAVATVAYLDRTAVTEHYAVGGPAATASPASVPIVGANRYATAAAVASRFFAAPSSVALVTGTTFADALSGGAAIGARSGPLLLTSPTSLSAGARDYLTAHRSSLQHVLVVGGEAAISRSTRAAAVAAAR